MSCENGPWPMTVDSLAGWMEHTDIAERLIVAVVVQAVKDAQRGNPKLSQEAAGWLWDVMPCVAARAEIPRPGGGTVSISISNLLWAADLPVFSELLVSTEGAMTLTQSYKANSEQELRGALLNYRNGDRLSVSRFPDGWKVQIERPADPYKLRESLDKN